MKFSWQIDNSVIEKVKNFYNSQKDNSFVLSRIERNVKRNFEDFSREIFWKTMISCLVTTQQRSGPYSKVTKFICAEPFPLDYHQCQQAENLGQFGFRVLSEFGLRRGKTIGEEIEHNLQWLEHSGWDQIRFCFLELKNGEDKRVERKWAQYLIGSDDATKAKRLKGIGPKQSRNLLQSLGLTRYEIPLDSRVIKWLHRIGFPLQLSGNALADGHYYNFVLDGFQKLCSECDILPCVLDAAIFSSMDPEWPVGKIIW